MSPPLHSSRTSTWARIAAASGVSEETLAEIARRFGEFPNSLALPGGSLAGQTNCDEAMLAVMALNALAGHVSGPGSLLQLTPPPPDPAFAGTQGASSYADVQSLIDTMRAGEIDVLFVHGNPLYRAARGAGFAEALARVPYVVSLRCDRG